jgi:hypothetical protein
MALRCRRVPARARRSCASRRISLAALAPKDYRLWRVLRGTPISTAVRTSNRQFIKRVWAWRSWSRDTRRTFIGLWSYHRQTLQNACTILR